ncbi:MAG: tyrosine-type recombinase/integrase [Paludibacteraceae bacterium]|nr:tyrosine-type recombinase/integrase [Paludibacteraceae bacterium]
MATINAFVRSTTKETANIRFRITDGRGIQLFVSSKIEIEPELFDKQKEQYKSRAIVPYEKRAAINSAILEAKQRIIGVYNQYKPKNSIELKKYIVGNSTADKETKKTQSFFDVYDIFLQNKKWNETRRKQYVSLKYSLLRYELFNHNILILNNITSTTIYNIEEFLKYENIIIEKHPYLTAKYPTKVSYRGENTIVGMMRKVATFINWCLQNDYIKKNPLIKYTRKKELYGTPFYLTKEELEQINNFDYTTIGRTALNIQRDIFLFQCDVGCRIGNLLEFTVENLNNGFLEYVPTKTKGDRLNTVRVPLSKRASEIVTRYKGSNKLLPFISAQNYNNDIKDIIRFAGVDRVVTVINPTNRQEEHRKIYEIASSHLARRTFIGNLYKRVSDPNLIGSMSGHVEGSKAFARYRQIDDEMKKNLIKLLE